MKEEKNNREGEITIEDLARMMKNGLDEIDGKFNKVYKKFDNLETDIKTVKTNIDAVKVDTEDIKANLNKKVDKIEYNTLEYRVEKLEKKFA
jgi:uncharacterized protein YdcH (DUF465 family)